MKNIVLFGPPGAGKGTQSALLVDEFALVHLSTGDIFRRNIREATELGRWAKSFMDQGQLVPDDVTIAMLKDEWTKHPDAAGSYLTDSHALRRRLRPLTKSWRMPGPVSLR